jgi:hypothetical protein
MKTGKEEEPLVGWKPDRDLELLVMATKYNNNNQLLYLFLILHYYSLLLGHHHLPRGFPYMGHPKRICAHRVAPSGE